MRIAFDKVNISPELPVKLSGFGGTRWAKKIHDPIYTRLFLFDNGTEEILWIQADLVGADDFLFDKIQKTTGINSKNLILSCTHTHSGPTGTLRNDEGMMNGMESVFGDVNALYCKWIAEEIGKCVDELRKNMKPFKWRMAKGKIADLGTDRHDASLPCDDDMLIIEFKTEDKRAMLLKVACHPTVLNGSNLEVSADYCGAVEACMSEYDMTAVVNGSCGDMSTRFTRQSSGFEEVERFGKLVKDQVIQLINSVQYSETDFSIEVYQKSFTLKVRESDTPEVAAAKLTEAKKKVEEGKAAGLSATEIRLLVAIQEGAENNLLASRMLSKYDEVTLSVSAIKLPDITVVTVPVELFSKLSNPVKQTLPVEFVGYTNGYMLYMPDAEAYKKEYYEAGSSPFAPNEAEKLMEMISEWLNNGIL